MPRFVDYHEDLFLPDEAVRQLAQDTKDERADQFGVRQVELFYNATGQAYCLLDAPDAEAVRRHHDALGLPCGEVHEVQQLL